MDLIMENKKGQQSIGMSFGMIFAIFLIVVFIVFAFIAIKFFLDINNTASVGLFYQELQENINDAINQQMSDFEFKIDLPSNIDKICFANLTAKITNQGPDYEEIRNYEFYDANIFVLPPKNSQDMPWNKINGINITRITETKNPYCVPVSKNLRISKGFYDKQVLIQ